VVKINKCPHDLKVRRKKAALNNEYLASLLLRIQAS
jgi:hypothetical protein